MSNRYAQLLIAFYPYFGQNLLYQYSQVFA
jgi:hypothetical protein